METAGVDPRLSLVAAQIRAAHDRSAGEPIAWPDQRGAFPRSSLSKVCPVVVDAMALRDQVLRITRTGQRTIMVNAANTGALRLYCAPHVVEEVDRQLSGWATIQNVDPRIARTVWCDDVCPLLRCVQVPEGLTSGDESERLAILADPDHRYGDPDDLPTATLALLLSAPLLSRDKSPLRAVYGEKLDYQRHIDWQDQLRAAGDLAPLDALVSGWESLFMAVGVGAVSSTRRIMNRVTGPNLLFVGVLGALAFHAVVPTHIKRRLASTMGAILAAPMGEYLAATDLQRTADEDFRLLTPRTPDWDQAARDVGSARGLARACLLALASAPPSNLSARELTQQLNSVFGLTTSEAKVRATLRSTNCFTEPSRGRFQVGGQVQPREIH